MPDSFYQGRTVAITGASSGLGAEFARQLAPQASRILITARREASLDALRTELTSAHPGLVVEILPADLASEDGLNSVTEWLSAQKPDILINNAGLGDYGPFSDSSWEKNKLLLQVNITALTRLTHAALAQSPPPRGILLVSSLASTLPIPELATYAASKAYVTSFSEALRIENQRRGVHITALCPGPIPTEFGQVARREAGQDLKFAKRDLIAVSPEFAIRKALEALAKNKPRVFPGLKVRAAAFLFESLPRPIIRFLAALGVRNEEKPAPPPSQT